MFLIYFLNPLEMLSQLFGGRTLLESKLESLVFCITKADRSLATLRKQIVSVFSGLYRGFSDLLER